MFNNGFFNGFGPGFGMPGQNNGGLQFSFGIAAFPFTFLSWVSYVLFILESQEPLSQMKIPISPWVYIYLKLFYL